MRDVSRERRKVGEGTVWYLESEGTIYRRIDGSLPFNVKPNRILKTVRLGTEVQRLSLVLPAEALHLFEETPDCIGAILHLTIVRTLLVDVRVEQTVS